jgi:REP element-mobilizing transposase RayT
MSYASNSRSLRKGRCSIEGQPYLLTSVTRGRERFFDDFWLGCLCSRVLTQPRLWFDAQLLAWVLMPDHLHMLVELRAGGTLPKLMKRIKNVTSLELGRASGRSGIWQDGYHDHALRCDESVREAARYIVANPIRAGLARSVAEYPFWGAVWVGSGCDALDP